MTAATIDRPAARLRPEAHAAECDSCAETLALFPEPKRVRDSRAWATQALRSSDLVALHLALGNRWAAAVERSAAHLMEGWTDAPLSDTARRVLARPLPPRRG